MFASLLKTIVPCSRKRGIAGLSYSILTCCPTKLQAGQYGSSRRVKRKSGYTVLGCFLKTVPPRLCLGSEDLWTASKSLRLPHLPKVFRAAIKSLPQYLKTHCPLTCLL